MLRAAQVPAGNVFFHHNPTNDAWCRDHGPCFIQRRGAGGVEEAIVDWGYNAWGGKYPPFEDDDVIPSRVAAEFGLPVFNPGIVMEGGSLDVNGRVAQIDHLMYPALHIFVLRHAGDTTFGSRSDSPERVSASRLQPLGVLPDDICLGHGLRTERRGRRADPGVIPVVERGITRGEGRITICNQCCIW